MKHNNPKRTTVTRVLIVVLFAFIFQATLAQAKWDSEGWLILLKVKFGPKFLKQYNETYREPIISPFLQEKIGKEMSLRSSLISFSISLSSVSASTRLMFVFSILYSMPLIKCGSITLSNTSTS